MSLAGNAPGAMDRPATMGGLRFAVFSTRNFIYMIAVIAMNYTLMRPSPVDMLFILSFIITLFSIAIAEKRQVTVRVMFLSLLLASWAVSYILASLPHLAEKNVVFELLAKTFAISIGLIGAFVSMTWNKRHFETFMKVYIVSTVIGSLLGTFGFIRQIPALTWDGRARGLIDDPNMYGSFLLPGLIFSAYFLFNSRGAKLYYMGAMALILLGILLSFSRIAVVAASIMLVAYVVFQNRKYPRRLILMMLSLLLIGMVLFSVASLSSPEFIAKLSDRLTFAKSYDLGEEGRYHRYVLVIPMILSNPIGLGVLQLEKIFPEPIHNIWLSSFVNYGWLGGFTWITLVISSVIVALITYRRTQSSIMIALILSLGGIIMCSSLHEGEHWRHMWLMFGLIWGFCAPNFPPAPAPKRRRGATRPPAVPRAAGPAAPGSARPAAS